MDLGASPRPTTGPAGGGKGQGAKSNSSQNWQSSLRDSKRSAKGGGSASASRGPSASRRSGRSATPDRKRTEVKAPAVAESTEFHGHPAPMPPGHFPGFYDPYAGPHPAGYGAVMPVEYDSFAAPHYNNQYPNGEFFYDRPVMYSDLPAYMPSYKDFVDRKSRKMDSFGREVQEKSGTRRDIAESMIPPQRLATGGYRPSHDRNPLPAHNIGAGWGSERSAQDIANSHAHSGQGYYLPERFESSKHRVDWQSWTREEKNSRSHRVRRLGDDQWNDEHIKYGQHSTLNPPGVRHNKITNATVQQSRAHGDVMMSTKPLRTL